MENREKAILQKVEGFVLNAMGAIGIARTFAFGGAKALPLSGSARAANIAEARRMVQLENGPDSYPVRLSAVAIGNVAMIGLPCEPFTALGLALKQAPGWDLVLPCCLTNGHWGYVGMKQNYIEASYETRGSRLKSGCGEMMIENGLRLLEKIR